MQILLDFLFYTDIIRVSRTEEKAGVDYKELSNGGVKKLMLFFGGLCLFFVEEGLQLCFCVFVLQEKWEGNVLGICHGRKRRMQYDYKQNKHSTLWIRQLVAYLKVLLTIFRVRRIYEGVLKVSACFGNAEDAQDDWLIPITVATK